MLTQTWPTKHKTMRARTGNPKPNNYNMLISINVKSQLLSVHSPLPKMSAYQRVDADAENVLGL